MVLRMRDLPRLTVSILFRRNKLETVASRSIAYLQTMVGDSREEEGRVLQLFNDAVKDYFDSKVGEFTVCKVLLPKLSMKLRKLQNEGMFIVGLEYEEAEPQPEDQGDYVGHEEINQPFREVVSDAEVLPSSRHQDGDSGSQGNGQSDSGSPEGS